MITLIMLFLAWLLNEPVWGYVALGFSGFTALVRYAEKQKQLVNAQAQKEEAALNFLKALQSKMN